MHHEMIHAIIAGIGAIISLLYLLFAWQCGVLAPSADTAGRRALRRLMLVFILCMSTGHAIPAYIYASGSQSSWLLWAHLVLYVGLLIATAGLVVSGSAAHIRSALS